MRGTAGRERKDRYTAIWGVLGDRMEGGQRRSHNTIREVLQRHFFYFPLLTYGKAHTRPFTYLNKAFKTYI